jgi:large subunit ribosomal protein L2
MAVKKFKPVTPGQRLKLIVSAESLSKAEPEKSLLEPYRKSGGRNKSGKMTMRYIGGGHKKMYRIIDFKRDKDNIAGKVATIEYDPNRTGYIAKLVYEDGEKRYILSSR